MAGDGSGAVREVVREVLAATPGGCTWLLPVHGAGGAIVDFRVAAASGQGRDLYRRGVGRVDALLSKLYPGMVGGPLWRLYGEVVTTGVAGTLPDYRHQEKRAGIVAESLFDVSVYPVLGGLLVWWQRLDEDQRRLEKAELLGSLGWAEYDLTTGRSEWSAGMFRIFERDPELGPMSLADQSAAMVSEDRPISETAWQTLDSGAASDVTVRFRLGGTVKHLRILSDVARDADGSPLKIQAVVQDVTAREDSRTAIERLSDQLRTREMSALAEHRLAAQLQNMIQPVPMDPFPLDGLQAILSYLPAERAMRVSGDWYHAHALPDGWVVLAIGDVAGHGLEAASGMAYLRFGLVAWLSIGIRDPTVLAAHMNRLSGQLDITGTAIIAMYRPATRTLHWVRAGHMPPMLARAGSAGPLERPPGLLLGADPDAVYPAVTTQLRAGDLVLFYTDGLVERRRGGGAERLERVKLALSAASTQADERMLVHLRNRLSEPSPDDDTCMLVARVSP
jgi:serine phosphatase RsbU (regulator of sigma subunit)